MAKKTFDEVVLFARTGLNPRTNFKLGFGKNKYITIKNIHNNEIIIDEKPLVNLPFFNLLFREDQMHHVDYLISH